MVKKPPRLSDGLRAAIRSASGGSHDKWAAGGREKTLHPPRKVGMPQFKLPPTEEEKEEAEKKSKVGYMKG